MEKLEKNITVINKRGLHARPAALLVNLVEKYNVNVTLAKGAEVANAKSIMGLLMLAAVEGTVLTLTVEGDNAQAAMDAFEQFFSKQEEDYHS